MTTTPTTTTTTPPSTPILHGPLNVEYLNESWCELQYKSGCSSTGSISHINHSVNPEILEKLLQEAQKESQSPTLPFCYQHDSNANNSNNDHSSRHLTNESNMDSHVLISRSSPPSSSSSFSVNRPPNELRQHKKSMTKREKESVEKKLNKHERKLIELSSDSSSSCLVPVIRAYDDTYDYDDDEVDLEYVEDDDNDDDDDDEDIELNLNNAASYSTTRTLIAPVPVKANLKRTSTHLGACSDLNSTCNQQPCDNCVKQKRQIEILMEKQITNEKELIKLRNEYEIKLLNKSLEINSASSTPSSTTSSNHYNKISSTNTTSPLFVSSPYSSSGSNTPESKQNKTLNESRDINSRDWVRHFASRPQTQPPKEWNFIHPNSGRSKFVDNGKLLLSECSISGNNYTCSDNCTTSLKLLNKELSIGKLIFTHMASFIVGATLMFLVLKRHLNVKNSIYFI